MTYFAVEPLRNLARAQSEMSRWMREAFDNLETANTGTFIPPVDIIERGEDVVLVADLPGMRREEIELSVENRTLTLSGERKYSDEYKDCTAFRTERPLGRFTRTFTLPATVDVNRIKAEFNEGLLMVTLPKAEEARPRRIEIKAH